MVNDFCMEIHTKMHWPTRKKIPKLTKILNMLYLFYLFIILLLIRLTCTLNLPLQGNILMAGSQQMDSSIVLMLKEQVLRKLCSMNHRTTSFFMLTCSIFLLLSPPFSLSRPSPSVISPSSPPLFRFPPSPVFHLSFISSSHCPFSLFHYQLFSTPIPFYFIIFLRLQATHRHAQ
jgi:hypothetical protein